MRGVTTPRRSAAAAAQVQRGEAAALLAHEFHGAGDEALWSEESAHMLRPVDGAGEHLLPDGRGVPVEVRRLAIVACFPHEPRVYGR